MKKISIIFMFFVIFIGTWLCFSTECYGVDAMSFAVWNILIDDMEEGEVFVGVYQGVGDGTPFSDEKILKEANQKTKKHSTDRKF